MLFRPDRASRGSLNGPHAVQVVLIWSWVAWRQDTTRGLILDGAPTLRWKEEGRENDRVIMEEKNEQERKRGEKVQNKYKLINIMKSN